MAIFCAFMAGMDIKYVAHLARLALTPEEEEKLGAQLGNILHYVEKVGLHYFSSWSAGFTPFLKPSKPYIEGLKSPTN